MTIQELLAQRNLIENVNYQINEDEETGEITILPLLSIKWEFSDQLGEDGQPNGNKDFKPVEYMPEIESVVELEKQCAMQDGLKAQALGAKIIARVWSINEAKQLSPQDFNALISDQNLAKIERLLWSGSLKTAKVLIQMLDDSYFSEDEKTEILTMIDSSGIV